MIGSSGSSGDDSGDDSGGELPYGMLGGAS